jgi:peroxiredoxin
VDSLSKFIRYIAGITCISLAISLVLWRGLPQRAEYSGILTSQGYVAPEIGAFSPPIDGISSRGTLIQLGDYQGRWVVLNFWATWCEPCLVEMPELQHLHETQPDIAVLGVNLGESAQIVNTWLDNLEITYPAVLDESAQITQLYQIRGQPITFIIAPDGKIKHIFFGATSASAIQQQLNN